MPNWSSGTMKLRGNIDDISRFVNEGLMQYEEKVVSRKKNAVKTEYVPVPSNVGSLFGKWEFVLEPHVENYDRNLYHVEGIRRGFVSVGSYLIHYYDEAETIAGVMLYFIQAWSIDPDDLQDIGVKYNLDVKVKTTESGMGFTEFFEYNHETKKSMYESKNDYEDWFWEVDNPFEGG